MKKILKLLLISLIIPASIYAQENKLKNELFLSIQNGELETVKKIIEKDQSLINSENRIGTPLISAIAFLPHSCDIAVIVVIQSSEIDTFTPYSFSIL